MSFRWVLLFLFPLVLSGVFSGEAVAETPSFEGTYILDEAASDRLVEAFEPALQEMGRVRRTLARRILSRSEPQRELRISEGDGTVTIASGDRDPLTTPTDGTAVERTGERGDEVTVRTTQEGRAMRLQIDSDRGRVLSTYQLDASGQRLTVTTVVNDEELPKPVQFRQVYNRR